MEERIPKYDIDFRKENQDHFFLHIHDKPTDRSRAITGPHSHNYYCFSLLYEGRMPHFADLGNHVINSPALLVLNIDQVHIHAQPDEDCKMITMAFSAEFVYRQNKNLANYIETVFSQPYLPLSKHDLYDLDKYMRLICLENDKGKDKNVEIIKCLLAVILIKCAHLTEQTEEIAANKNELFLRFKNVLNTYFKKNHQVKFYAGQLNVTTSALTEILKKTSHKTPKQLIDERLFMEAKRLLYWSDSTVREVAWELGFETDGYFIRFFKKFAGTTPGDFQRAMQLNEGNF